jgi:hypothetical protein
LTRALVGVYAYIRWDRPVSGSVVVSLGGQLQIGGAGKLTI